MSNTRFLWLVRHAETEWSRTGRHTGRTDLPLTSEGVRMAEGLAPIIARRGFVRAWSSPLQRARSTAEVVGLAPRMEIDPDLCEWDYGAYEGLTSQQIERERPGWDLWRHGCPGGETLEQVRARADRVLVRVLSAIGPGAAEAGDVALVSHGHFLRVFVTAWLELPPSRGRSFGLHADSISVLGFEHGNRVLWSWDWTEHLFATGH